MLKGWKMTRHFLRHDLAEGRLPRYETWSLVRHHKSMIVLWEELTTEHDELTSRDTSGVVVFLNTRFTGKLIREVYFVEQLMREAGIGFISLGNVLHYTNRLS